MSGRKDFQIGERMTTEERLQALEHLWDAINASPDAVSAPAWHEGVLSERITGQAEIYAV